MFPNPVNWITQISFTLNNQSNIKMEVLDFHGKIISTVTDMIFGKGENGTKSNSNSISLHPPPLKFERYQKQ